jgi:hypothetical protein
MAKVELRDSGNGGLRVRWWDWLIFAAVLELYIPSRKRQKMQWWDWLVLAVVMVGSWPKA